MISTFANIRLEKNYSFSPNSYSISQSIVVTNNSNKNLIFRVFEEAVGEIDSKEHIMFNYHSDDDMETVTSNPSEYEKIIADIDWYGFAKKYFLASSVLKQDGEKTLKYKKYSKTNLRSHNTSHKNIFRQNHKKVHFGVRQLYFELKMGSSIFFSADKFSPSNHCQSEILPFVGRIKNYSHNMQSKKT